MLKVQAADTCLHPPGKVSPDVLLINWHSANLSQQHWVNILEYVPKLVLMSFLLIMYCLR